MAISNHQLAHILLSTSYLINNLQGGDEEDEEDIITRLDKDRSAFANDTSAVEITSGQEKD